MPRKRQRVEEVEEEEKEGSEEDEGSEGEEEEGEEADEDEDEEDDENEENGEGEVAESYENEDEEGSEEEENSDEDSDSSEEDGEEEDGNDDEEEEEEAENDSGSDSEEDAIEEEAEESNSDVDVQEDDNDSTKRQKASSRKAKNAISTSTSAATKTKSKKEKAKASDVASTSHMASHGPMTASSVANTPAQSTDHKKKNKSSVATSTVSSKPSTRRTRNNQAAKEDLSDEEDRQGHVQTRNQEEEEDDDDAFAAESMVVPSVGATSDSTSDKRQFKHLDPFALIPIRVSKTVPQGGKAGGSGSGSAPQEVIVKKYSIPAPPTTAASIAFDKMLPGPYTPNLAYVRFRSDMIRPRDYEMTYEDEQWLSQKKLVESDKFEKIITAFEVATNTGSMINGAKAFSVLQAMDPSLSKVVSDEIHAYWQSRRQKNQRRSLLRRFWPITPAEDTTPTLTFRPREKERYKLRKKRMNDLESYEKLLFLKRDFERVITLLDLVKRREEMKRLEVELIHAEYLERLNSTNVRPACLDTPLAPYDQQIELLDLFTSPLAHIYATAAAESHRAHGSHRRPSAMHMEQDAKAASASAASGSGNKLTHHRGDDKSNKGSQHQSHKKKKTTATEEERDYNNARGGGISAGSGGAAQGGPQPGQTPAAEPAGPQVLDSQSVPTPRYLLEPSSDQPLPLPPNASILQRLYPPMRKRPVFSKQRNRSMRQQRSHLQDVHIVPRFGRNRRLLFDRVHFPHHQQQQLQDQQLQMLSGGERGSRGMGGMMMRPVATATSSAALPLSTSSVPFYPLLLPSASVTPALVSSTVDPARPSPAVLQKIESLLSSLDDRGDDEEAVDTVDFAFFDVLSSSLFPRYPEPAMSSVVAIPTKPPKFQLML